MTAERRVALREVATIERDVVDASRIKTGTLFVGLENIESGGRFANVRPVDAGELASSKFAFTPRHVLYGKLRPYLAKIARPDFEGICSTDILPVLPGPELDRGYLSWLLLSPEMVSLAASRATGANLPRLSPSALAEMRIPLPPLSEQRRIAELLDKADVLRAKRRTTLSQTDSMVQSLFLDSFGTSGKHRALCREFALGDVALRITDGVHKTPRYVPHGVPFVTVKNIVSGSLDLTDTKFISQEDHAEFTRRTRPEKGDLLVSKDGTIGVACPVNTDAEFSIFVSVALIKPNASIIELPFLVAQFRSASIQRQITAGTKGIAIRHLHLEDFAKLRLVIPPIELQRDFCRDVDAIQAIRTPLVTSLSELEALFAALQHRAFRGEL